VSRSTVIIIILLLLPLCLFAKPLSLGVGPIQEFQTEFGSPKIQIVDVIDVNNWASGSEIRAELYNTLSLDGYMLLKQGDIIDVTEDGKPVFENDISQRFFGMLGLSLKTKVATLTTLSVGAGAMYGIDLYTHESPHFWVSNTENIVGVSTFENFINNLSLAYRARLDFNFSRFSLGVSIVVPSLDTDEDSFLPDWKKGKIAASFITRVF
jgi:hypothetical protein